jgi:1,4-dihydroxy-6-naphthoate synthase
MEVGAPRKSGGESKIACGSARLWSWFAALRCARLLQAKLPGGARQALAARTFVPPCFPETAAREECPSVRDAPRLPPLEIYAVDVRVFKENLSAMSATQSASKTEKVPVEIKLAHSPDSDDAFMFYALATHKLATPGYKYTHVLSDIQTLNEAALTETYDVTAVSFAAYPSLRDKYVLLDCGASFGEGYGPIVVSNKHCKKEELAGKRIGVPGLQTTAYLTLKLYEPNFEPVVMPFDKIIDAVQNGVVEAGLLIHEGQLFFSKLGLHRVIDLGIWWQEQTDLPLPLGGNAVRRALGPQLGRQVAKVIRDSVSYGLEHREEALNYAMQFAREMDTELADKFVGMYVNKWTLGYGERGKKAVTELIERGTAAGLLPGPAKVEFLSEN